MSKPTKTEAELVAMARAELRPKNEIQSRRTVGCDLQFRPCHRNKFGFGLGGLAHDGGFLRAVVLPQVAASAATVERTISRPRRLPYRIGPRQSDNPRQGAVETGSLFTVSGDDRTDLVTESPDIRSSAQGRLDPQNAETSESASKQTVSLCSASGEIPTALELDRA